jgi:phenylacetate-CoA ligase
LYSALPRDDFALSSSGKMMDGQNKYHKVMTTAAAFGSDLLFLYCKARMKTPRSRISDIVWPGIPGEAESILLAMQFQLEQSQWWPAETLTAQQFRQMDCLLRHAHQTVPYYREVFDEASVEPTQPLTPERWAQVPLLTRDALQDRMEDLLSTGLARQHGKTFQKKTSGSTGRQIQVTDTDANRVFWMAITLRDHLWHRRDFGGTLVAIRSGRSAKDPLKVRDNKSWGPSTGKIYQTGPSTVFYHLTPIDRQAELLQTRNPDYLLAYPSNAVRLAHYFRAQDLRLPNLREVLTYGESVLPETQSVCRETWDVPVSDMYSCEEVGYIALQCPQCDQYHIQSESLLVEVLDDEGHACAPGQIGKVVLTALHNFAMPLIRYQNQDYAEVGEPCPCGRGLPVLKRILGRERNMALATDGSRFWPHLSPEIWSTIGGIDEVQLIQKDVDRIEVIVVCQQPLDASGERDLTSALRGALGQAFRFSIRYQDEFPRHANGKYERFICQVDT